MRFANHQHAAEARQVVTLNAGVVFARCAKALQAAGDSIQQAPPWRHLVFGQEMVPTCAIRPNHPCALTLYRGLRDPQGARRFLIHEQHANVAASFRAFADNGLEIAEGVVPLRANQTREQLLEATFD